MTAYTEQQILDAIEFMTERKALPEGLEFAPSRMGSPFSLVWESLARGFERHTLSLEFDYIWLAAALAEWEAWAIADHGIRVLDSCNFQTAVFWCLDTGDRYEEGPIVVHAGDPRSRLVAKLMCLVDGVRAVEGGA